MSRKRGRQPRQYRIRVRTVRREPIDAEALARAALEHAAMNQQTETTPPSPDDQAGQPKRANKYSKGSRRDRLA